MNRSDTVHVPLGSLLERIEGGGTPSKAISAYFQGNIPFVTVKDFKSRRPADTVDHISEDGLNSSAATLVPPDTLLVTTRMSIGKIARFRSPVAINQDVKALFPSSFLNKDYLEYFLISCGPSLQARGTGTTVKGIKLEDLRELMIPLVPLEEQRRIAVKLDNLLARSKTARDELSLLSNQVERYKQAILSAAFSGLLTAKWRESQSGIESGTKLLQRIKDLRFAKAKTKKENAQITRAFLAEHLVLRENEQETIPNIPELWTACRVGAIGSVLNGSTPARNNPTFWNGTIPWVTSGEVRNNIIQETRERITKNGFENSSLSLLPPGTVLLAMIGEGKTRGQTAVLAIQATINQNVAAVVLNQGLVVPQILWRWFQLQYQQTRQRGAGNGPKALNCQAVRELPFVLAPFVEQQEIVRQIEASFAHIDRLPSEIARALSLLDRLDQAALERAFRRELVPHDTNDESVSALIESIRSAQVVTFPKQKRAATKRKALMPKMTTEFVLEAIRKMPRDRFSFEDLRSFVSGDYDELKQIVFHLLEEPTPSITHEFDLKAKEMRFERSLP